MDATMHGMDDATERAEVLRALRFARGWRKANAPAAKEQALWAGRSADGYSYDDYRARALAKRLREDCDRRIAAASLADYQRQAWGRLGSP